MFRLATPWALALLPLVVAAVARMWLRRERGDARMVLPAAARRARLAFSPWVVLDRSLPLLRGLALVLLVGALARPQSGSSVENVTSLGVDIVIAIDVSGSMQAEDFQPDNRLAVAKKTVQRFAEGRPTDRLALVAFASLAATRCPLTVDQAMFAQYLDEIEIAPAEQQLTAIGLGLATAVNRLRDSQAKSRVVILLTDGENNAGQIGPQVAADAASALGVKVYTIGVGSDRPVPFPVDLGPRGKQYQLYNFPLDEELLRSIADQTGGRYFKADDPETLQRIFETIDTLEKSEIESKVRVIYTEQFAWLLFPALLLLLIERVLLATRLRRIP